ncbi:hypothetical protein [Anaerosporobacter sp.]|uniref:hypothetical protein n=1 Tax=Anaerosporobacter sp. TaxID=1872529 RepID=UPI00286F9556|nr:hypothetical protein [Anaerosporobacter sp.]
MRKLYFYQKFDPEFITKLSLLYLDSMPLQERDGDSVKITGAKTRALVIEDQNKYGDEYGLNKGETITVKQLGINAEDMEKHFEFMRTPCKIEVEKATIWGDFNDKLSIYGKVTPVRERKGSDSND